MKSKQSAAYRLFYMANYIFLGMISILCLLPIIHVLAISLSGKGPANANLVGLWPVEFSWSAYKESFDNEYFSSAFIITVQRLVLGTTVNMLLSIFMAYPLSKETKIFPYRNVYVWILVFTMLFSGGLIPTYIQVNRLGLINSIWSLVLPGAVHVFHIILLLNFFRQLPRELEEAAFIDGASHFVTLFRIYLPLSMPAIATLLVFSMVSHWNSWFDGLIFMSDSKRYPLQTYLQTLTTEIPLITSEDVRRLQLLSKRSMLFSQIFMAILPILCTYPFLQKYFTKGIVLGSVKG